MALPIVSGASTDQLTVDPTSKAARITLYSEAGQAMTEKATYRAIDKAATTVASATSPFFVLQGSATKTLRIIRVRFSITYATGAAAASDLWTAKFTTITAGTTRTAITVSKADSNDGNATGVVTVYSAVPTTATLADGFWTAERLAQTTLAATGPHVPVVDIPYTAYQYSRPMVLRGTGQFFGVGLSSIGTTPVHDLIVEWTEE